MIAAGNGNTDAVRLLIEKGANINATDKDGDTALSFAKKAKANRNATIKVLRDAGAKE